MENKELKPTRWAPIIIWCVRLFFSAVIWLFGKHWLISVSLGTVSAQIIFFGFVALSSITLIASFVRSKISLTLLVFSTIAIPLAFFLSMDIFMSNRTLWDWCIAFPAAVFIEMAIPVTVAFYMWKAPKVRNYYLPNAN
jgi:hypothetical protein